MSKTSFLIVLDLLYKNSNNLENLEKKEDDLLGRRFPWEMTSITGNQQSIIKYKFNVYVFFSETQMWNSTVRFNSASAGNLT